MDLSGAGRCAGHPATPGRGHRRGHRRAHDGARDRDHEELCEEVCEQGYGQVCEQAYGQAYEYCRAVARRHGRTYYLATSLLPAGRRPHVWALYAFARTADDLVDDPGGPAADDLAAWERRALAALRAETPPDPAADPVVAAAWATMRALGLDVGLWEEFARSMRMDLTVHRYATFDDLRRYMRGSAAVIGELMAPVLGVESTAALRPAARLGEAFQLTNFIRDVGEDLARGRIYLPQEDLARTGVTDEDIEDAARRGHPSPRVAELIDLEVDRALALYDEARPGIAMTAPWARPCLEAAFILYRDIALAVRARGGNVFAERVTVPRRRRALVAAPRVVRSVALRALSRRRT